MDSVVEFCETGAGVNPLREFLDELKASDPDDFGMVLSGLARLSGLQLKGTPPSLWTL